MNLSWSCCLGFNKKKDGESRITPKTDTVSNRNWVDLDNNERNKEKIAKLRRSIRESLEKQLNEQIPRRPSKDLNKSKEIFPLYTEMDGKYVDDGKKIEILFLQ
ncbi:unnamed protein product [Blepharisma stoltei]|uniref:Uncharacterized protein n=1 Tax=Blepharisma stoltei TaxID=1481888 RepID=A0AAU9JX58_9CILI|nr:unnamed protein product [Blepharisma stoltei]